MKLTIFFALFMVIFVAYTAAQCPNNPHQYNCFQPWHTGHGGHGCWRGERWYYSPGDRSCKKMDYQGCGGNENRFCSWAECERYCRR